MSVSFDLFVAKRAAKLDSVEMLSCFWLTERNLSSKTLLVVEPDSAGMLDCFVMMGRWRN